MVPRRATRPAIGPLPTELESPRSKLVYLYLTANGGATSDEIVAALGLPAITLLPILRGLRDRGVVVHREGRFLAYRPTDPPADRP